MINLLWIIPSALALLFVLYVLCLRGRSGHPDWANLRSHVYAHRGLHGNGVPENSMAAFRAALQHGYGIELDLHLLKDGELAVIHDHSLLRTTGVEGNVEDLTADQLHDYRLEGTDEHIPTFREVLTLFDGKAPLIIELKAARNYRALVNTVCEQLKDYKGAYCIESFDPRCLWFLRKLHPHVIRGQLAQNFLKRPEKGVPWLANFLLTHQLLNFLTLPDFAAFRFEDRRTLTDFLVRKFWGVQGVSWTLRNGEDHKTALEENRIPIFEYYEP